MPQLLRGEIEYFQWLGTVDKSRKTVVHVIVAQETIKDVFIGTYFLGSDRYCKVAGHLWQTMVYYGQEKVMTVSYDCHVDAVNGHRSFVEKFKPCR
jgi:hypothetical protein